MPSLPRPWWTHLPVRLSAPGTWAWVTSWRADVAHVEIIRPARGTSWREGDRAPFALAAIRPCWWRP